LINPQRMNTYHEGFGIERILLQGEGEVYEFNQPVIPSPYAARIRGGEFRKIKCFYPSSS